MAAAVGPAIPAATPGALFACAGSPAVRACCSSVYTATAYPLPVRMAPCGVSTSPRAHAGPAAPPATPAGEKRPIAAILDAAALSAAAVSLLSELYAVETSLAVDDAPKVERK